MVVISQNPINNIVIGVIAIIFLVFVANKVVKRTIKLSEKLGISQMFLGLTALSIGTSLPEITTGAVGGFAILSGKIDPLIASGAIMGTSIGSDIVQQTFMFGLVGILAVVHLKKIIHVSNEFVKEDGSMLIVTAFLLFISSLFFLWLCISLFSFPHKNHK